MQLSEGGEVGWAISVPETRSSDFIEPKNVLDESMREAVLKLDRLVDETRERFVRDYGHQSWFQDWAAMAEPMEAS